MRHYYQHPTKKYYRRRWREAFTEHWIAAVFYLAVVGAVVYYFKMIMG